MTIVVCTSEGTVHDVFSGRAVDPLQRRVFIAKEQPTEPNDHCAERFFRPVIETPTPSEKETSFSEVEEEVLNRRIASLL